MLLFKEWILDVELLPGGDFGSPFAFAARAARGAGCENVGQRIISVHCSILHTCKLHPLTACCRGFFELQVFIVNKALTKVLHHLIIWQKMLPSLIVLSQVHLHSPKTAGKTNPTPELRANAVARLTKKQNFLFPMFSLCPQPTSLE